MPAQRTRAMKKAPEPEEELSPQGVAKGKIFAQWSFLEYEKPQRGPLWYVLMIGIGGGLLIYAVLASNFLFALIILLFGVIIFTHHRAEPLEIICTIYETGMQVGDRFYLWRELESFWVIYEPPLIKRLYIAPKGALLRREISIPLGKQNPLQIRSMLLDYVEENVEKEAESPTDTFTRLLKL